MTVAVLFYVLEILKQLVRLSFICIITGYLSLPPPRYTGKSYCSKFIYSKTANIATCHWINYIWWMVFDGSSVMELDLKHGRLSSPAIYIHLFLQPWDLLFKCRDAQGMQL